MPAIVQLVKSNFSHFSVECPRCFKLLHRDSIKEHINVVHFKQNKFQCDRCDYSASRYGRVMMHKKACHNCEIDPKFESKLKPRRQCSICGSMVKNYKRHVMKVHMNIKNYHCDNCTYGAFFKFDLGKWPLAKSSFEIRLIIV